MLNSALNVKDIQNVIATSVKKICAANVMNRMPVMKAQLTTSPNTKTGFMKNTAMHVKSQSVIFVLSINLADPIFLRVFLQENIINACITETIKLLELIQLITLDYKRVER